MNTKKNGDLAYIVGQKVILRPLIEEDFTSEYLRWLNDPEINRYSQRRSFPLSWEDMKSYKEYFSKNPQEGFILAIIEKNKKIHIGNIAVVNIQLVNHCAEIAILIGNKDYWGKGYGAECMYLLTKHLFNYLNLNKVFAGSFNPAFVRCVEKLGWIKEGEFKERIWSNGRYHNQIWMSILKSEFKLLKMYEDGK